MTKKTLYVLAVVCLLLIALFFFNRIEKGYYTMINHTIDLGTIGGVETVKNPIDSSQRFAQYGLETDTSNFSVPLENILHGGPQKDGIPSIDNPTFITVQQATSRNYIDQAGLGIVLFDPMQDDTNETETLAKFYPYSIMNWHEIVNDMRGEIPVAVTFCPLCGTAIVYERTIQTDQGPTVVTFGVSGLLYESNLLMYDRLSETLWSQALGRGVAGTFSDQPLSLISSDITDFATFAERFPNGLVLSDDIPQKRDYTIAPYGDYDSNDILYFPVSNSDTRLPKKELLYVINDGESSVAFVRAQLVALGSGTITIENKIYTATLEDGLILVRDQTGTIIPGYHEMRFSWITHNPHSKNIWMQ